MSSRAFTSSTTLILAPLSPVLPLTYHACQGTRNTEHGAGAPLRPLSLWEMARGRAVPCSWFPLPPAAPPPAPRAPRRAPPRSSASTPPLSDPACCPPTHPPTLPPPPPRL